jgi:uncharacterized protein YndB with AHSA1/START domain
MEAKDGSFGFDFEAIYDEVAHESRLAYTMTDGRKAETAFEDRGEKTRVLTVFDAEQENSAEMQRMGWQAILDNFKKYAESSITTSAQAFNKRAQTIGAGRRQDGAKEARR